MINVTLRENETNPFESAVDSAMDLGIKHFERELVTIRTGRAHTSMIEDIKVFCYGEGTPMPLKSLASLSAPEARLLIIQPWDKSVMPAIEKAIMTSEVGLTPLNDGNVIRLQLPEITSSRRDELKKILHKKLEECRVAIRQARKDFHNLVRDAEKEKKISEDFSKRLVELLQKRTDHFVSLAEQKSQKKESELSF